MSHRRTFLILVCLASQCLAARPAGSPGPSTVTVESAHYRLISDLEEELVREIGRRMDALHAEYDRRLSEFKPKQKRADIRIYRNQDDYKRFVGQSFEFSSGVFMPDKAVLATFAEGKTFHRMMGNLAHEGFHQFMHAAIPGPIPSWVNEGLAQYFEDSVWTGDRFATGDVSPWRLVWLKPAVADDKTLPLGKLFALKPEDWVRTMADPTSGRFLYDQAWSVVHFMVHADNGKYRVNLLTYLRELDRKANPANAYVRAFGYNTETLQKQWRQYVEQLTPSTRYGDVQRLIWLGQHLAHRSQKGESTASLQELYDKLKAGRGGAAEDDDGGEQSRLRKFMWRRYLDMAFTSPSDPTLPAGWNEWSILWPTTQPQGPRISYRLESPADDAQPKVPVIRCLNHKDFDLVTRYTAVGKDWIITDVIQSAKK